MIICWSTCLSYSWLSATDCLYLGWALSGRKQHPHSLTLCFFHSSLTQAATIMSGGEESWLLGDKTSGLNNGDSAGHGPHKKTSWVTTSSLIVANMLGVCSDAGIVVAIDESICCCATMRLLDRRAIACGTHDHPSALTITLLKTALSR